MSNVIPLFPTDPKLTAAEAQQLAAIAAARYDALDQPPGSIERALPEGSEARKTFDRKLYLEALQELRRKDLG